ncbi:TPA: histidine phosphatase family protein [Vibrio parahaemolyticus]|uniref:histidine phosphatase family protein n=1 Tax=Vibrio parahaemolyticus TaxID=670 RepID=UPI0006A63A88|nr:histidine phosphatase family protein [Vibrio parahaemolyticus]KOE73861.1 phosphoglycerate mutase [Vibrio parahaemolyticus]HAS6495822.1 histidine phosphatase family protein [Vibrio parahaemolyticus]HAS6510900.1 histidine phosphatase family protein [Vibrio parahaemolyticus]HAS6516094.1 histidine phosphatase family protein [Vibrio parahaemolyticus]HAS6526090.1 histidine phosphatase family protein [Vibrio parahaemolyticus]
MEIVFVRHGVPDYSLSDERKMTQLEKDYAPLNRDYIHELHAVAEEIQLEKAEVIISSPYTRALQTAEIINRKLGLELFVEHDLREWRADLDGAYVDLSERDRRWHEYRTLLKNNRESNNVPYESWVVLRKRAENVLSRYTHYSKVIVVSHFNVFESLAGYQDNGIGCGSYRSLTLEQLG